jgi:CheY-like chemotaxis protein
MIFDFLERWRRGIGNTWVAAMAIARSCVLVVDDEKEVLEVVETILIDAGFAVATAGDGAAALQIVEKQPVDLAVVDVRLPGGLNGLETVRRARARQPDLKALFISGIEPIPSRRDPDREDFVSKPFSGHELLGCVFELLLRNKNGRQRVLNAVRTG